MKKFTRILSFALILVMLFSLCACGKDEPAPAPGAPAANDPAASAPAGDAGLTIDALLAAAYGFAEDAGYPEMAKEQMDVYMAEHGDLEAVANAAASSPKIEITFSHSVSASSADGMNFDYLANLLELFSGNSIEVKVFPAATLVDDNGALDAIMSGNVDLAKFQIANITPTMPEMIPFEIPGAFPADDYWGWTAAVEPVVDEIFLKYGVKYIGPDCMDTQNFLGLEKCYTSPADFAGQKIRVSGKWYADAVEIWGGAPVTIGIGDLASALERKTVDGVYTTWRATDAWVLYDSAKYITYTTQQENLVGIMMNLKKWDSLTEAQQNAVTAAYLCYRYYVQAGLMEAKDEFMTRFAEEYGGTVHVMTDEENAVFIDACAGLVEEAKKSCGELGNELFNIFAELKK